MPTNPHKNLNLQVPTQIDPFQNVVDSLRWLEICLNTMYKKFEPINSSSPYRKMPTSFFQHFHRWWATPSSHLRLHRRRPD